MQVSAEVEALRMGLLDELLAANEQQHRQQAAVMSLEAGLDQDLGGTAFTELKGAGGANKTSLEQVAVERREAMPERITPERCALLGLGE